MNNLKHPMHEPLQQQVGEELLDALVSSPSRAFSRLQIAQVARSYQVPVELAEEIANTLFKQRSGVDVDAVDFQSIVKQISEIENTVADQGLRLWKLQGLARRSHRSYRELMECYNKALLNQRPLETIGLKQLRARTETETKWLIPGWLPQGTNVLFFGDGGTGKTLMAYQWLEAVATGSPWNGYQVEQGRCLLVQCDEPEIVLRNRMDLLQLPDDAPIDIITDWSTDAIPRLRTYIEQSRPKFILIDSLSAVNKSCIFSENDMEYARPILHLTQLCSEFEVTICLIHHSNAVGQARGTRAIHNSVSEVWALRSGEGASERVLSVLKTRLGRAPGSYKFLFNEDDHSFAYCGNADDPDGASATQEEKIRLWLYQEENRAIPYTPIEIAEKCAISQPSTRKALQELWAKGVISRRPSKLGKRGYVYSSPALSTGGNDPAILSIKARIATKDRDSTPDHADISAVRDPAIPLNSRSKHEYMKKEGSQDRERPEAIQEAEKPAILACDPCDSKPGKDRKKRCFPATSLHSVTTLPEQGTPLASNLRSNQWESCIFLREHPRMAFSRSTRKLEHAYYVEFADGERRAVPVPNLRRPEGEHEH